MKTVLITGASRGIGAQTALHFATQGVQVAVHYHREKEKAEAIVEKIRQKGVLSIAVQADISEQSQVEAMVGQVVDQLGAIDCLVNNAGVAMQSLFTDTTAEQWRKLFAIHVDGTFYCTQAVLPAMIQRQGGSIVNVSSIWGISGASCEVAYSSAKAAVIGMTKALAREVGPSGIRVNCVAPGVIDTDMNRGFDAQTMGALKEEISLCRLGTTAEVASSIYYLASAEASFITGQVLTVDGGMIG